ncbi:deoxycytidine monophosphate deaminase Ecym_6412 [Eremothecium cymbalariae DBVPG|uniref:Deoxycytidylate deaminase n=1 Tax=Eremothecium cymbalariae (strain CBS 270.75 / DBVPG 7215 / KCTC 17166 / NRRL Y-17582) TaxID=931890 RepID=G8JUK4_ERECY|nr:hypothetical protein Ecym_6412 [Eremothecium cymbalariae DBVPG\
MLIGVSGTYGSFYEEVARYFERGYGYKRLKIEDFSTSWEEVKKYATENYDRGYVVTGRWGIKELRGLEQRPFFVHISVDGPIESRFRRSGDGEYEVFIQRLGEHDDQEHVHVVRMAPVQFYVSSGDSGDVMERVGMEVDKLMAGRSNSSNPLRPDWDTYFMKLAHLAASRSNCMKRRVGCVIVRNSRVIATGYNGTPRHLTNCYDGGCPRCNDGGSSLHTCLCLHAEENALLEAGRDRIGSGAILYCDTCPCLTCSIKIVQTGITQVVYSKSYRMDNDSFNVLKQGGVVVRQFSDIEYPRFIVV